MLNLNLTPRSHIPADCAVFFRSRERHGQLSNMTHGFPLAACLRNNVLNVSRHQQS